jgi:prolipoprotein diacylglyceryltransferase
LHPELWTIPGLNLTIPSWGFFVAVALLVGILVAIVHAKRAKIDPAPITTIAILGAVLGWVGCRGMYFLHYFWTQIRSGDVGAAELVDPHYGGEIMGGVLLAVVGVCVYLAVIKKPIRLYLDVIFPSVILGMGIGRIGCFLAGCCFGQLCTTGSGDKVLPWAVRFPYGSPAYVDQWAHKQLTCPDELLWVVPRSGGGERPREPIPRQILADDAIHCDEDLMRWAQTYRQRELLLASNPNDPGVERLADQLRQSRRAVEGRPMVEFALAIHLARLSSQPDRAQPVTLADLRQIAASQTSHWVHPTQIYDLITLTLLFFVLSAILRTRKRHGMVVAWGMVLYSVNRFVQEAIRADNPHDVAGLTISQFLSIVVFALGVIYMIVLIKFLPPQSTRAIPAATPPAAPEAPSPPA